MLEVAPSLSASLPVLAPVAAAPAPVAAVPGDFARALADARAEAVPAGDRQDFAAPGKTALAALPELAPLDAKRDPTPVSRVLPTKPAPVDPVIVGPLLHKPAPEVDRAPTDEEAATTDDTPPDQPQGQPVSGYLSVVLLPPVVAAGGDDAADTAPIVQTVATATPATSPRVPVKDAPVDVDLVAPKPVTLTEPPVSRRLSLKLDPSIEVIDAGRAAAPTPADQPPVARPALKLVSRDLPPPVPLSAKPEAVVASGVPQPAAHVFARAIALAQAKPTRIESPTDITDITTAAQAIAVNDARPVVLAPRALDTTREDWPQRLIDRVDAARDAANAADTRIRLVPETLGKIDIALRQDGDTLHVHFTADQAATRDLLNQAQPRLAELAEARGLRLGQTGVDGGSSDQPRRQPVASAPVANPSARAITAEEISASDDRIA